MELLKVEHLCKTYGDGENQVNALSDISFTVEKGEFVAITGASGSGKSTLLHIIGGVDVPDSGRFWWTARKFTGSPRRSWQSSGAGRWGWFISSTT